MELLFKKKSCSTDVMDKRAFERIPTSIDAKFFYGNLFYSGKVLNVSEKGMFINTKRCLPSEAMFVVIFRTDNELFKMIARVKRVAKADDSDGIGVELVSPSIEYLELLNTLKVH